MPLYGLEPSLQNYTGAGWGIRCRGPDDRILSLHLSGFSPSAIQRRLKVLHEVDIPLSHIASVVDVPMHEVAAWRTRPLHADYPVICVASHQLHASPVDQAPEIVCVATGITMNGERQVLGLWLTKRGDTSFERDVLSDLRDRGVKNVLIACTCTGVPGDFGDAINTVFPLARILPSIGEIVRHTLAVVPWKQRAKMEAALKRIYRSAGIEEAERHLRAFETRWGHANLPMPQLVMFLDYPGEVRKVVTAACGGMEVLISSLGKVTRHLERHLDYPGGASTVQLTYLAIAGGSNRWKKPVKHWKPALNQLRMHLGSRLP